MLQAAKYKPGDGLVQGQLTCPASGTCVFILSNASPLWSRIVRFGSSADTPHVEEPASPRGSVSTPTTLPISYFRRR